MKKMIVIGGTAMKKLYPDFPRDIKDLDYAVEVDQPNEPGVEYLYNPILIEYCDFVGLDEIDGDTLLTLKASHLTWDINWEKHMWDCGFLVDKGHKINKELFLKLYYFWNTIHGKNKRSNLTLNKEEFFDNLINTDIDHDSLHLILNPTPIYTLVLADDKEVELDENKYNNLTNNQKLDFIREEVMVMASERFRGMYYKRRYSRMLKKFVLGHAPIFALPHLIENFKYLALPKYNFMEVLNTELAKRGEKLLK